MAEKDLELLGRAIALDSEHAEASIILGQHFCDQRDFKRAIPFFRAAADAQGPRGMKTTIRLVIRGSPGITSRSVRASSVTSKTALEYSVRALPGHPEKPGSSRTCVFRSDTCDPEP